MLKPFLAISALLLPSVPAAVANDCSTVDRILSSHAGGEAFSLIQSTSNGAPRNHTINDPDYLPAPFKKCVLKDKGEGAGQYSNIVCEALESENAQTTLEERERWRSDIQDPAQELISCFSDKPNWTVNRLPNSITTGSMTPSGAFNMQINLVLERVNQTPMSPRKMTFAIIATRNPS